MTAEESATHNTHHYCLCKLRRHASVISKNAGAPRNEKHTHTLKYTNEVIIGLMHFSFLNKSQAKNLHLKDITISHKIWTNQIDC
jgi:hypothetical protein